MGRRPRYYDMKGAFNENIKVDERTGCWVWQLDSFRFRVLLRPDSIVLNPRRYAAFINGYNIQVGRNVINGCANPKCVNPEHTILKHDRRPISKHTPFYLDFTDLEMGSLFARMHYGRPMEEMRIARKATLDLIKRIKLEPLRMTIEHIVNKYDISPRFATKARKITIQEYRNLERDHSDNGETPMDERGDELPPDAHLFM